MKIEQIASNRGYVVTEEGVLLNRKSKEVGSISKLGYMRSMIRVNGIKVSFSCHGLQAYQKYGLALYNVGILVRHKDGDSLNNSWDNILIGTHSDNMMDIPKQVRVKKAQYASSFTSKYNKEEVKKFHKLSKSYIKTMDKFNISSKGTLNYILNS